VIDAKPKPYEETKKDIEKILYNEKIRKKIEEWADKLREVSEIKIFLTENNKDN
jgi:hypothetical protein